MNLPETITSSPRAMYVHTRARTILCKEYMLVLSLSGLARRACSGEELDEGFKLNGRERSRFSSLKWRSKTMFSSYEMGLHFEGQKTRFSIVLERPGFRG